MAAKDIYHQHVRRALEKDGWTITDDPLSLPWLEPPEQVDLGAEGVLGAEKAQAKIAVTLNDFIGASPMADLEKALGQFALCRTVLMKQEPDRHLYLALREDVFYSLIEPFDATNFCHDLKLRLLVFSDLREEVVQWIS